MISDADFESIVLFEIAVERLFDSIVLIRSETFSESEAYSDLILDILSLIERLSELCSDKLLEALAEMLSDFFLLNDSDSLFEVLADSLKLLLREAADLEALVLNDCEVLLDAEVLALAD